MFKSSDIRAELNKYFIYLEMLIKNENVEGRNDINKECEDIIKSILNVIYDLELKNVNEERINYPAIDLADVKRNICYQITSNLSKNKISDTIQKFKKYGLNKKYSTVNFLFLKAEQKNKFVKDGCNNDTYYNILFLSDLIKDIIASNKKEEVLNYLREEVGIKMIAKSKKLVSYDEIPMIDIYNNKEINIFSYNSYSSKDLMHNFYGNCFNFLDNTEGIQSFRLELEIENCGKIPINNICIDNLSISYNIGEVDWDEYTVATICEYTKSKEINNLINPNKSSKLNLIFEDSYENEVGDEIIIEFSFIIVSEYSIFKNKMWFQVFCSRNEDSEETIVGKYKIDAIKIRNQVVK